MYKKLYNLPLKLQKRGFYYGWVVLLSGTLGIIMSVPGQTMGVSVYTDSLIEALGIDRTRLSLVYMLGTIGSALLLPFAGRILDKVGARVLAGTATLALAGFLTLLGISPYAISFLHKFSGVSQEWVAMLVIFSCFLGIRHFGQGQLTMASRTMMGLWFERKRGLMLGLSGVFVAFGFGIAPLALNKLIESFGWSHSLLVLASLSIGMSIFAWLFFRRSPEHCGLVIDGGILDKEAPALDKPLVDQKSFTAKQAKATYTFWVFNFAMVGQALLITAVTFHISNIARYNGIDSAHAFSIFLPLSIVSICADLGGGFLSDRVPLKYLLATKQLGLILGLGGVAFLNTKLGFGLTAFGLGLSSGLFALLHGAAWPKLFGRAHLGSISGAVMSWIVLGSAVGPYIFSLGQEGEGNYKYILFLSMLYPALVMLASFFANPPKLSTVKQ
ncbi:MFS transporter [bacterium]|nr:MFS transporter [bacterium]